jgi:hypothetical protein
LARAQRAADDHRFTEHDDDSVILVEKAEVEKTEVPSAAGVGRR